MQISVCIITKNEENNLEKCLKALQGYGFELVVVDTGSTDGSKRVAKKYTDCTYNFRWCDDFSKARNFAVSKASNEYIISIDSDEFITGLDLEQLEQCMKENPKAAGRVMRKNCIRQKEMGMDLVSQEYISRIFSKKEFCFEGKIHEQLVRRNGNLIDTYLAPVEMDHTGYYLNEEERMEKASRNIRLLETEMTERGEDPYLLYQLGKSHYLMGDYEMACERFGKALTFDLEPRLEYVIDMVEAYGYSLLNGKRQEEALFFENILDVFGNTSDFRFLMGLIYMNNERFDEAAASFETAVELKKARVSGTDSYLSYYNIGVIRECLGFVDNSMDYYIKCGEYLPAVKRIGLYYERKNPKQAYLYYLEHKFQFERNGKDVKELMVLKEAVQKKYQVQIPKTFIVILSYNTLSETEACINSIRENVNPEDYELIVVDNGSKDNSVPWLKQQKDIRLCLNTVNQGFPKGCNQGIAAAGEESDIWLLNSDTLVPPKALFYLRMGLYESLETGAVGSVSNYCPNYQNIEADSMPLEEYFKYAGEHPVSVSNPYEKKVWLVGFSLLIKRTAVADVGLLDERFSPGNYEDTDYGYRLVQAGYQQLLCKNSFVFHHGSKSFGKKKEAFQKLLEDNCQKFIEKWGIHPSRYSEIKTWEVDSIRQEPSAVFSVLELGCGTGATLARLKYRFPNAQITGIEKEVGVAKLAQSIGKVIEGDIHASDFSGVTGTFDEILTGGIWELESEAGNALFRLCICLKKGGHISGSFFNKNHGRVCQKEICCYTAEEWIAVLESARITVDEFSFRRFGQERDQEAYQYFWKGHYAG